MRAAAKLVAQGSRGRSCVAWRQLPPALHRSVRLGYASAPRELLGVHPSSQIGTASIAPGVRIGPFCVLSDDAVIGPNCELGAGVHILGSTTLGADCVVKSHAVVGSSDPGTTRLGKGNTVGAHAVVGVLCADKKHAASSASHLVIGDNNDIRELVRIHRSSGPDKVTKIGNDVLLMGGVHVAHDCEIGDGATVSVGGETQTQTNKNENEMEDTTSSAPPKLTRTSPESLPEPEKLKTLNMASLKALLQVRGLPTDGMKYLLIARLDQNRDAPLNLNSNAASIAAEASDVAWRVRDPNAAPNCVCGEPCVAKVVRKEGQNKGKTFWACRRPKQAAPCGFFQWKTGTKKAPTTKKSTRAVVTPAAPRQSFDPTVSHRGGSDMFEDLVIMSSSARKRGIERDAAEAAA